MTSKVSRHIPYGKHKITNEDVDAVVNVLLNENLTQGTKVPEFEEKISQKICSDFSLVFNSATSALHVALKSLDIKKGDIVWTTPNTFVATANSAIYCNANIDFVDIDYSTGLMNIDFLKEKLEKISKKDNLPKVVIPVHLSGTSCNMEKISILSKKYGFKIIEDASHAIGGKYQSQPVGNCKYSDITIFSLHPVKIITTGEGGIATTNKIDLYKKMKILRSHGITKDKDEFLYEASGDWYYEQQFLGFNYRLTDIQASLGISQLKRLDSIVQKRNEIFIRYKNDCERLPIEFLKVPDQTISSHHLAVMKLANFDPDLHKRIFIYLRNRNIGVQLHYLPVHLQPFYRQLGFKEGDFPNSEKYALSAISLPIYPELINEDQKYVIDCLKYFFNYET